MGICKNKKEYVNDLNSFYARIDYHDFSETCNNLRSELREQATHAYDPIATYEVRRSLTKINTNKACGPDRLSGKLLKCCSDQLAEIFTCIFNLSIKSMVIPKLWKTSEITPVPKRSKIESMNDLRPVALTPAIMKVFERFVLKLLINEVKEQLDPLQFAYKAKTNVEDACLVFTNNILNHLEKNRNYARV